MKVGDLVSFNDEFKIGLVIRIVRRTMRRSEMVEVLFTESQHPRSAGIWSFYPHELRVLNVLGKT